MDSRIDLTCQIFWSASSPDRWSASTSEFPSPMIALVLMLGVVPQLQANTCWTAPGDLYGGDIEPLGAGFRNASTFAECCTLCAAEQKCKYLAFTKHSPKGSPERPPHNCWLKSSAGTLRADNDRVHGGVNGTAPPAPPTPSKGPCTGDPAPPWCNLSLSIEQRVAAALAEMTVEEKSGQIATYTPSLNPGVPRIGWPKYGYHSEGLHGLRDSQDAAGLNATIFPQTTAMAATGNLTLIGAMASVMATEARAVNSESIRIGRAPLPKGGSLFFWSPTMNVCRGEYHYLSMGTKYSFAHRVFIFRRSTMYVTPRYRPRLLQTLMCSGALCLQPMTVLTLGVAWVGTGGRFQESITEDPWLLGAYSTIFLQNFQKNDSAGYPATIASCKHFLAVRFYSVNVHTNSNFLSRLSCCE